MSDRRYIAGCIIGHHGLYYTHSITTLREWCERWECDLVTLYEYDAHWRYRVKLIEGPWYVVYDYWLERIHDS